MGASELEATAAGLRTELEAVHRRADLLRTALESIEALLGDDDETSAPTEHSSQPRMKVASKPLAEPAARAESTPAAAQEPAPEPEPASPPAKNAPIADDVSRAEAGDKAEERVYEVAADRPAHTRDAIVEVMADDPGEEWSPQTLTEEMERRRWSPDSNDPVQAIRAATSRLAKDGRIERVRKGAYRISIDELARLRGADAAISPPDQELGPAPDPMPRESAPAVPPPIVNFGN